MNVILIRGLCMSCSLLYVKRRRFCLLFNVWIMFQHGEQVQEEFSPRVSNRPNGMLTTWRLADSSFCKETVSGCDSVSYLLVWKTRNCLQCGGPTFFTFVGKNRKHSVLSLSKLSPPEVSLVAVGVG